MSDEIHELTVMAARTTAALEAHINECTRVREEGTKRLDHILDFMKTAHAENRKDVGEIKITLAEQRGAGKVAKAMGAAAAAVIGGASGLISGGFIHK